MHFSLGIWDRLPRRTQKRLTRLLHPVRFGNLRHTSPVSEKWGFDRGTPVDRYYIDRFLEGHRADIHGQVLEVGAPLYTDRFGAGVSRCDILDHHPTNHKATLAADLSKPLEILADRYDCLVFTQVLHLIYNLQPAIHELHRILKPGGVLLATFPCASRIETEYGPDRDYWRFTPALLQRMFTDIFGEKCLAVQSYGNVLSCIAFMEGMASEELSRDELDIYDPIFPLLVGVRAQKGC
jgi:SAM-dependent methyltransferase